MQLMGRRLHIAGSASRKADPALIVHAQRVVRELAATALRAGMSLTVQAGAEPHFLDEDLSSPALVFDWEVMEVVHAHLEANGRVTSPTGEPLLLVVSSEKAQTNLPQTRLNLWYSLLHSGALQLVQIAPGHRAATLMREIQARESHVLVTIGGGAGVEHLADLYAMRRRPVIPLDAPIGSSREDGLIGGEGLARRARAEPRSFFRLDQPGTEAARLAQVSTRSGAADPSVLAQNFLALLQNLAPPSAFFVRLLNRSHPDFRSVEAFFRNVVEPVVVEAGYRRHEVGTDDAQGAFINLEIFEELHHSPLVIADLTGARPNCYLELGYALRGDSTVLITAKTGTEPPFDPAAMPWHFWEDATGDAARRAAFQEFWQRNTKRPPLVRPKGILS